MNRLLFSLVAITEWALRFFGLDVYIERDTPRMGFFNLEHIARAIAWEDKKLSHEFWGFGLHVIVCPLDDQDKIRAFRLAQESACFVPGI
ncbi:MAG: hypothetical protein ABIR54_22315 [Burkholderiaceae bacterium]